MKRVIIAAPEIHPLLYQGLEELGYEPIPFFDKDLDKLYAIIADAVGIVYTTYTLIDSSLLAHAQKLKFVARVGSGMENTDIAACKNRNIAIINSAEGLASSVSEHALGMLLALLHNISRANSEIKQGIWFREQNRGAELGNKCVGIIGMGNTGKAFAKVLRGFEVKILYADILEILPPYDTMQQVEVREIQHRADIISFHLPLTTFTHKYVHKEWLNACKKKPILINTSRGNIIDTVALSEALLQGQISGLCIDVFEDEPISSAKGEMKRIYDTLLSLDNVVATPHIAGWSIESKENMAKIILQKIRDIY
jgi:D-3-phosphoglycerate dehydrogenase